MSTRKRLPTVVRWTHVAILMYACLASAVMASGGGEGGDVNLVELNQQMAFWTWLTFALLLAVLYGFAWKPILAALEKRETDIRDAVENAERLKRETEQMHQAREKTIAEADQKAKDIVTAARAAALEASKVIQDKARDEAKIMLDNAQSDIEAAKAKAEFQLRREAADLVVRLGSVLIGENLDDPKNRALVDRLIKEM